MKTKWQKVISLAVPYIAVYVGLCALKNAWIAIVLYHFGMALFLIADGKGKLFKSLASGWNWTAVAGSAAVCAVVGPAVFVLWQYMQLEGICLKTSLMSFGLYGVSWWLFVIYFSTVHPLLEELYWRGYLKADYKYLSWSDFAFAGYHILVLVWFIRLPWLAVSFVVLSTAACGWRYIVHKFGGLGIPLLSHIVADISIIAAISVLIR